MVKVSVSDKGSFKIRETRPPVNANMKTLKLCRHSWTVILTSWRSICRSGSIREIMAPWEVAGFDRSRFERYTMKAEGLLSMRQNRLFVEICTILLLKLDGLIRGVWFHLLENCWKPMEEGIDFLQSICVSQYL